jgi:hypothetical protein
MCHLIGNDFNVLFPSTQYVTWIELLDMGLSVCVLVAPYFWGKPRCPRQPSTFHWFMSGLQMASFPLFSNQTWWLLITQQSIGVLMKTNSKSGQNSRPISIRKVTVDVLNDPDPYNSTGSPMSRNLSYMATKAPLQYGQLSGSSK